jgi:predicted membrane-bound mannosyltransferase
MATAVRNVTPPSTRPWLLPGVILAAGLVLRLLEYLRKDSLWGDEAMLALNVATRSFHQLALPLDYAQVAPVPFLWAERVMVSLFGVNEWALRAPPLIAGCLLCFAVIVIARRILAPDEALVALVLVAFSQMLIRYTAEFKPYGLDALLAVCLIGAAARLISRMNDGRAWGLLAVAGTIAVLSSLASAFVGSRAQGKPSEPAPPHWPSGTGLGDSLCHWLR